MSAHQVNDATLTAIILAGRKLGALGDKRDLKEFKAETSGMRMLAIECDRSVSYRYNEKRDVAQFDGLAFKVEWRELIGGMPDLVKTLKLLAYYDYQACQHPDYRSSDACRLITTIRTACIRALPGYEDAPWGL